VINSNLHRLTVSVIRPLRA